MTNERRVPDAQVKAGSSDSKGRVLWNGGNPSPLTPKERLRAEFPFTAQCVDDLRKAGISIKWIKSKENGKQGEWGNG